MLNFPRTFPSMSSARLRPRLACEIMPEGVLAGRVDDLPNASPVVSLVPLPAGSVTPSLATPNLHNAAAVSAAVRQALDEVAARDKQVTVVIPDSAVRVLLLDFDTFPAKQSDALPLIRFRLRKLLPFEVDEAAVSYQVMSRKPDAARVLVVTIPNDVLAEYEVAVRVAGYEPAAVLPSTLCSLATLTSEEPALVVNCNGLSVTTAITKQNELLLHRTLDLPGTADQIKAELQRTVSVALAYFEDTLKTRAHTVLYAGTGGALEFGGMLGEEGVHVRDLMEMSGMVAGVTGALAG